MNTLELVDNKNCIVKELKLILDELALERVDMLCDGELRKAIYNHIALDLKPIEVAESEWIKKEIIRQLIIIK